MWLVLPKRCGVNEVVAGDFNSAVLAACSLF